MMAMALMLSWGFTACDVETDEEPGGTNIEQMCGNWDVMCSGSYNNDGSTNISDVIEIINYLLI